MHRQYIGCFSPASRTHSNAARAVQALQRARSSECAPLRQQEYGLCRARGQGEAKERFNEMQQERSQLATQFSNNLLDATKAFKRLVTRKEEVEGAPRLLRSAPGISRERDPRATRLAL